MRHELWLGCICTSTLILSGCASPPKQPMAEAELLTLGAKVHQQSLDDVVIACPWQLNNPTLVGAQVGAIEWQLQIDGQQAVEGSKQSGVQAAPSATAEGTLMMRAPYSTSDGSDGGDSGDEQRRIHRYTAHATFVVANGPDELEFEAEWDGELWSPKEPQVVLSPQAARYDSTVELNFTVGIQNPNPFSLQIERLKYELFVEGQKVSASMLAAGKVLSGGAELQFDITRLLGRDDFHDLARQIARQSAIAYRFASEIQVAGRSLSSPLEGSIEFAR